MKNSWGYLQRLEDKDLYSILTTKYPLNSTYWNTDFVKLIVEELLVLRKEVAKNSNKIYSEHKY